MMQRWSSVLEPERSTFLGEKGKESSTGRRAAAETVVVAPGFRWVDVPASAAIGLALARTPTVYMV